MPINRILTDIDRNTYINAIEYMKSICPEMMSRKIPEANVQQAFVLDMVQKLYSENASILSVGCFEDTAYECLKNMNLYIVGIDPIYGYDLHRFRQNHNVGFDIAFATSVLEHVENDEEFIKDMCDLLLPNGLGILTMDFKDDYKLGDPLPATDVRFYTKYDLEVRLRNVLKSNWCDLVDAPDWSDKDNFIYQGHQYSFATFVFRKI